jgi:ankyrin repeat protein
MILDMKGVDLKAKNSSGQTPLYAACYSGNIDAVKLLLGTKVGPDTIEMANEDGWTPLHAACSRGELDVVRLLLDNSAKIDRRDLQRRTPLHIASAEGRDKVAEYLLSRQETLIHMTDLNSQTALHSATSNSQWSDRFDVVQVLVNKGAKVDLLDSEGCTALILSCRSLRYRRATEADESTVRRLADMTKNINHMDNEGYTALDW